MDGLILTVERKEFNLELDLVGLPIYYNGEGVLGNELMQLKEYFLIAAMDKTSIEVVDYKKRAITLDISQVNAAKAFMVVAPGIEDEEVVVPGTGEEQQP